MPSRARWWAGRWIGPWPAGWQSQPSSRRSGNGSLPPGWFITPIAECNMPATNTWFCSEAWNDSEYESASEPLRQRQLRKLHQDFEAGGNLRERIRGLRAFACEPRTVHRAVLQSAALALGAGLQLSGRV